ncbi:terpene synthase [Actinomadura soli]|uniref:Terpene synthase n=1 Tax=Actinomadura soli TaxID=2508997 RepID=A0A5C4JKB3_9ACTN|nr:terpene synthase family protein [Actinomadura soli]TMR06265.1 terpene synthase [Actinomadura soli]
MNGPKTSSVEDEIQRALEAGRTAALAADCQRDLQEWAESYPVLFSARPFDARLYGTVALANAFGAPWESADRLRIAVRASLWVFAADWIVDYVAKTRDEIDAVTRDCLAVADADGRVRKAAEPGTPGAELARCLADIQADLATVPAFDAHRWAWRDQLRRYLTAMALEWDWKADGAHRGSGGAARLTFEQYVANADNFGSSLVNIAHWIFTGDDPTLAHLGALWKISEKVQCVLRLLNDLATYERDVSWGDLNCLMLGVDRSTVAARITSIVDDCRESLRPLRDVCPTQVDYLERQIGYSTGFYGITDYWGAL